MFVNKMGKSHLDYGLNCQDAGYIGNGLKVVCDGCSEGKHTEVGAKTYCFFLQDLLKSKFEMNLADKCDLCFSFLVPQFINDEFVHESFQNKKEDAINGRNYLSFTILAVEELERAFEVAHCGDGYIILQDNNDNIEFVKLDDGEYPKYYVYNYIDEKYLKHYKDGVEMEYKVFWRDEYKNVGVASDGIRFVFDHPELMDEFVTLLKEDRESAMKRFINKHQNIFQDDVTICF